MTSWMSMLVPAGTEPRTGALSLVGSVVSAVAPVELSTGSSSVSRSDWSESRAGFDRGVCVAALPLGAPAAGVMVSVLVILVTNSSAMSWPRERLSPVAVAAVAYRLRAA